jgi:hypothetical protein
MARRNVVVVTMFKYRRSAPKTPFLGWGYTAIRKARTSATSPRLLKYRSCMAGALAGKKYANLKDIQTAFKTTAPTCAKEASGAKTIPKPRRMD